MISKELLSEVLKKEVIDVFKVVKSNLRYEDTALQHINIYELMHLMKEWTLAKGFGISSGVADHITKIRFCTISKDCLDTWDTFNEDSEFEAVTKACEWILKQHKGE